MITRNEWIKPMNAHLLESLYQRLGRPAWFWPLVFIVLLGLFVLGSSFSSEEV